MRRSVSWLCKQKKLKSGQDNEKWKLGYKKASAFLILQECAALIALAKRKDCLLDWRGPELDSLCVLLTKAIFLFSSSSASKLERAVWVSLLLLRCSSALFSTRGKSIFALTLGVCVCVYLVGSLALRVEKRRAMMGPQIRTHPRAPVPHSREKEPSLISLPLLAYGRRNYFYLRKQRS